MILRRFHRAGASAFLALLIAATVAACSGNDSNPVGSKSIVTPPKQLVSPADIGKTAPDSAKRAFLQYWSDLQYSAWSAALSRFEPALVNAIGDAQLVEAFKTRAGYFPTAAPKLRGSRRVGDEIVVRYQVTDPTGRLLVSSVAWRRRSADWRIRYDPQLDGMLQAAAQARVQGQIDPTALQPSTRALQAGLEAARLQSQYLETTGKRP